MARAHLPARDREHEGVVAPLDTTPHGVVLTPSQLAAVQQVMHLFIDDDLGNGVSPLRRIYCDGCWHGRPMAGFLQYAWYQLCNACATEYEVARMRGAVETAGQYVRDKQFGEPAVYVLDGEMKERGDGRQGAATHPPVGKRSTREERGERDDHSDARRYRDS
jgi:hypothetical protein